MPIMGIIVDMDVELLITLDMLTAMLAVLFMGILPMVTIIMGREKLMQLPRLILTMAMPIPMDTDTLMDTRILLDIPTSWAIPIPLDILTHSGIVTLMDIPTPWGIAILCMVILMDTLMGMDTPINMLIIMAMEGMEREMQKLIQHLHPRQMQMQMLMQMHTMDIMAMAILLIDTMATEPMVIQPMDMDMDLGTTMDMVIPMDTTMVMDMVMVFMDMDITERGKLTLLQKLYLKQKQLQRQMPMLMPMQMLMPTMDTMDMVIILTVTMATGPMATLHTAMDTV